MTYRGITWELKKSLVNSMVIDAFSEKIKYSVELIFILANGVASFVKVCCYDSYGQVALQEIFAYVTTIVVDWCSKRLHVSK